MANVPNPYPTAYQPVPLVSLNQPASTRLMHGQPINLNLVATNFAAITRSQLPRTEMPKYQQPYDQMNIMEQYHGRALPIESEVFAAEMMNERAMPALTVLAPILPMTERHITWSKREHYMLPFDIGAIGAVPRRTFLHKEERHASLQHYVRFASMEINYLLDVNFGRQMLNETLAVIIAQARLTLIFQFQFGLIIAAMEQSNASFAASTRSAQYIFAQSAFFAIGNSNPDDLALKVMNIREPNRKFSHLLVVEKMGAHFKEIASESRTVEGYHYGYDEGTERLVLAVVDAMEGVPSIPTTDGGYMAIIENIALRYSNVGAERMKPTQTLEGFATLCEVVLQPEINPDDDSIDEPAGLRDPASYDQTETSIEHKPFLYDVALSACGLWNNIDGSMAPPGEFGDAYMGLISLYNNSNKSSLKERFKNPGQFRGNNTPTSKDWSSPSLREMNFREGFPFLTLSQDKKSFREATFIGSLPESAFPTAHANRIVRVLAKHYATLKDEGKDVDDFMDMILPDSVKENLKFPTFKPADNSDSSSDSKSVTYSRSRKALGNRIKTLLETMGPAVGEANNIPKNETNGSDELMALASTVRQLNKKIPNWVSSVGRMPAVDVSNAIEDDSHKLGKMTKKIAALFDGILSEKEIDESKVTDETKQRLLALKKFLGEHEKEFKAIQDDFLKLATKMVRSPHGDSFWAVHIPDSHVDSFATTFARMQSEQATNTDKDAVRRGFDAVHAALRKTSGFASSRVVLNDLATHMENGGSVTDFGNGRVELVTMRAMAQNRPIPANEMKAAARARGELNNADDAMDIDGGDHPPSFGAPLRLLPNAIAPMHATFPLLVERLKGSYFRTTDEVQIFHRLMTAHFSHDNCYALYKRYGIQLFRFNYWRPWQRYRMYHMIAMIPGPRTAVTGFAQPIVSPSMQGMEGYINIVGQFWSAFIVTQRENIRLIPNVVAAGLLANINTDFVRTRDEWISESPIKPSTVVEVVPLDETKYNWPLHMTEQPTLAPGDLNERSPHLKHQGKDLMIQFASATLLSAVWSDSLENDVTTSAPMSLVGHRGWYMHLDKRLGRYNIIPGTSPRGKSIHNSVEAAEVWAGGAVRFATTPHYTLPTVG
jgi:hypothetical protein